MLWWVPGTLSIPSRLPMFSRVERTLSRFPIRPQSSYPFLIASSAMVSFDPDLRIGLVQTNMHLCMDNISSVPWWFVPCFLAQNMRVQILTPALNPVLLPLFLVQISQTQKGIKRGVFPIPSTTSSPADLLDLLLMGLGPDPSTTSQRARPSAQARFRPSTAQVWSSSASANPFPFVLQKMGYSCKINNF
ncbi:uncharacterized protein LOC124680511 [Lolium rigidum]|uniref:uncharacterized protein LOC124680511 n=1 Tax=Lolium rigidum TaxID=89674 RepID=UPI001F5CF161|nr:uncharacterized protein LOC124680511 [Lolium rigidum]